MFLLSPLWTAGLSSCNRNWIAVRALYRKSLLTSCFRQLSFRIKIRKKIFIFIFILTAPGDVRVVVGIAVSVWCGIPSWRTSFTVYCNACVSSCSAGKKPLFCLHFHSYFLLTFEPGVDSCVLPARQRCRHCSLCSSEGNASLLWLLSRFSSLSLVSRFVDLGSYFLFRRLSWLGFSGLGSVIWCLLLFLGLIFSDVSSDPLSLSSSEIPVIYILDH